MSIDPSSVPSTSATEPEIADASGSEYQGSESEQTHSFEQEDTDQASIELSPPQTPEQSAGKKKRKNKGKGKKPASQAKPKRKKKPLEWQHPVLNDVVLTDDEIRDMI